PRRVRGVRLRRGRGVQGRGLAVPRLRAGRWNGGRGGGRAVRRVLPPGRGRGLRGRGGGWGGSGPGRRAGRRAYGRAPGLSAPPDADAALGGGGELVLPALPLPGAAADADRGDGLRAYGAPAQRAVARHRRRARGPLRLPRPAAVGDPLAR